MGELAMTRTWIARVATIICLSVHLCCPALAADEPWEFTRGIEFTSRWPKGLTGFGEDRVTAVLYRPRIEGRVPAAVIINSSGGVNALVEHYYARVLSREGIAALVVDSFSPRGVRRTGDDQNRVAQSKSNSDAFAGHRWLSSQNWVDPQKIIVLGMSRGGEAAYSAALDGLRKRMEVGKATFAAHVAIAIGGCNFPQRDVRTTGGPIFFMLAELDETQLVGPCIEYVEKMRKAGTATIRVAVYPGVYHAYEGTSGVMFAADNWASQNCSGRFDRDENFLLYHRGTNRRITPGSQTDYLFKTCLQRGYVVGGDERVKAQATADLLQFLRDAEVISDRAALALLPDCATLPERHVRLNCIRARAGWTGDLVALARSYRSGSDVPRDVELAVRLFELAVTRSHRQAQWELAIHLRQGSGTARDLSRALLLAKAAADAGDASGMNVYGVMIRDGIGRTPDAAEARVWFERSADLLNTYGMVNLGRFHKEGQGGLPKNPAAAVALWRAAVLKGENPWALVLLAQALETGEGSTADPLQALAGC
ncbi:MAG: dienelactone hydrolase family protein [Hyphomicrobiaceae bacterium]